MTTQNKFLLDPAKAVLVVIDVQEKLCAAMDEDALQQLTKNAGILIESANELALSGDIHRAVCQRAGFNLARTEGQGACSHPVMKK